MIVTTDLLCEANSSSSLNIWLERMVQQCTRELILTYFPCLCTSGVYIYLEAKSLQSVLVVSSLAQIRAGGFAFSLKNLFTKWLPNHFFHTKCKLQEFGSQSWGCWTWATASHCAGSFLVLHWEGMGFYMSAANTEYTYRRPKCSSLWRHWMQEELMSPNSVFLSLRWDLSLSLERITRDQITKTAFLILKLLQ